MKVIVLINLVLLSITAAAQQVKWRDQPDVMTPQYEDHSDNIDYSHLKKLYLKKNKPIIMVFKGKELSTRISDWQSRNRFKASERFDVRTKNDKDEKEHSRYDDEITTEFQSNTRYLTSDTGLVDNNLSEILNGVDIIISKIGMKELSYANAIRRQQLENETDNLSKRSDDITKIEFDAILKRADWLITTEKHNNQYSLIVIETKSGVILAKEKIDTNMIAGYETVAGNNGYEQREVSVNYLVIGKTTTYRLIKSALNSSL